MMAHVLPTQQTVGGSSLVAEDVSYDNSQSNLSATNVQDAIDEVYDITNTKIEYSPGGYLRLRNIGTSYTQEMKEDISSGRFKKVRVGDYLTINNHVYYIAHLDYWLHTGDTECTSHHAVVVPASSSLISGKMNNSNVTTGGYLGSDFKTGTNSNTALADIKAIIQADFGASNILIHREVFTNAVTNGKASGGAWADSDIDLMNELMVYGCPIFTPANDGTTIPYHYTTSKSQLELFAKRPDLIATRGNWWLRDVVSATYFAIVLNHGNASYYNAGYSHGIRPAFAIC